MGGKAIWSWWLRLWGIQGKLPNTITNMKAISKTNTSSALPTILAFTNITNSSNNPMTKAIEDRLKSGEFLLPNSANESLNEFDIDFSALENSTLSPETLSSETVSLSSALFTIFDYDVFYNQSQLFENLSMSINASNLNRIDNILNRNIENIMFLNCTNVSNFCAISNRTEIITITLNGNETTNCTQEVEGYDFDVILQFISVWGTSLILGLIILATVIGNVFVIAAILLERHLQSVANYLILSLAVADLLVACLVMPLSAVYEVSREWNLGPELCDMWTSCDVLCCTASILHLVAIALDRYWAVTNIDYIHHRTARRIGMMILVIWALSFLVSIAPLLGWKDAKWNERVSLERKCMVSQDIVYQIFATASSFYVPLLAILILYWKIFQTAKKRIRRRQQVASSGQTTGSLIASAAGGSGGIATAMVAIIGRPLPTISETTTAFTNISSTHSSPEKSSYANGIDRIENDPPTADVSTYGTPTLCTRSPATRKKNQACIDYKRERKAAKTLVIITGAFVCSWLPFFILAILLPLCQCTISSLIISISLWLGYFNSTLNPIIYTIFSPEFRNAFRRILCGKRNSIRRRPRYVQR